MTPDVKPDLQEQILRQALELFLDNGARLPFQDTFHLLSRAAGNYEMDVVSAAWTVVIDAFLRRGIFADPPRPLASLPEWLAQGYLSADLESS